MTDQHLGEHSPIEVAKAARRLDIALAGMHLEVSREMSMTGGELLTLSWLTLDDIRGLDLPLITVDVLDRLKPHLDQGRLPAPETPISFQYYRGRSWIEDTI